MLITLQFWMLLALISGISGVAVDVLRKSILTTSNDHEWVVMFRLFVCVLPFAILWWVLAGMHHSVSNLTIYGSALGTGIVCEIIAQWHYQVAVKALPLSVCRPMMEMTMIGMIPLSYLFLKMPINLHSLGAIAVFLLGIFAINSEGAGSWMQNLTRSFKQKEIGSIAWVVLFWSMTTVLQKVCLQYTDAPFFTLCLSIGLIAGMIPMLYLNGISFKEALGKRFEGKYILSGLLTTAMAGLQFTALSFPAAHPSIVIVLKRTAQLFYVVIDQIIFKTRITRIRVIGNLLAFTGILMIAF